jgi:hypothetical protein
MIYEQNYKRLKQLIPDLENLPANCYRKSKSNGFMDLSFEILSRGTDQFICAMAHYFEMNGDLVADPDMEVKVVLSMKMIEALTYQDQFGFQVVYPEPGKVNLRAKKELNQFLGQWLKNLIEQGHRLTPESQKAEG